LGAHKAFVIQSPGCGRQSRWRRHG